MSHHNHHDGSCSHQHHHHNSKFSTLLFVGSIILYIFLSFVDKGTLSLILHIVVMLGAGYHVILEGITDTIDNTKKYRKFIPNVHILMTLAAFGSLFIEEYREGALLIIIFAAAHSLEDYAQSRSRKDIQSLLNLAPSTARRMNADGSIEMVDVSALKIGDKVSILNGDQVPTDGIVFEGNPSINQASITGESMPIEKVVGDVVFGSSMNGNESFIMEVTKDSKDTVIAKIIKMVNESQTNVSKTAAFIKRLEPIYVTIVLCLVPVFYLMGRLVFDWESSIAFYRTMVFLIVTSPCALAATDIPASLSAISNLAKQGILFKGGAHLSNFAEVDTVAFDKTGTITEGKPQVLEVEKYENLRDRDLDVLYSMEVQNNHPLAVAITDYLGGRDAIDVKAENKVGKGIIANVNGDVYQVGSVELVTPFVKKYQDKGCTLVSFTKNDELLMFFALMDKPKDSAQATINYLKDQDIQTVMISGDNQTTAQAVADGLGIASVYGGTLPENKVKIIQSLQSEGRIVAMFGDGVNDAPSLANANVGIAMGNGTDIAIDVADGVFVESNLLKLIYTHKLAKKLRRIVVENIIFAMTVVVFLVIMNVLGRMDMTLAVLVHEGSTLVVIFNGLRLLKKI